MHVLIMAIGILQILAGALFFISAKSAIHEILGSLTFGLGILSVALAAALSHLDEIKKASEEAASNGHKLATLQAKVSEAFDRIGR